MFIKNYDWKIAKNTDKGRSCATLLTDLSKVFGYIVHNFSTAKIEAHCVSCETLKNMHSYLTDRKHRIKIDNSFYVFINLSNDIYQFYWSCVPQTSILGPLLFKIYICDLFFFIEEEIITSYVADRTLYSNSKNGVIVIKDRKTKGKAVFNWFSWN